MITLVAMNWDRIFMRWTSLMNAKGSVHWILTHVCTQEATAHSLSCSFPVSSFPTHSKGQTPLSLLSVRLVWLILESYKCSFPVRHSCAWLFRLRVMLVRLIWVTVFWKIFISFVCVCVQMYTLECRCSWSPEECFGAPVAGVMPVCLLSDMGTLRSEFGPWEEQQFPPPLGHLSTTYSVIAFASGLFFVYSWRWIDQCVHFAMKRTLGYFQFGVIHSRAC